MNNVILIGRLTKDPDVRYLNDIKIAKFTLAVDRNFKSKDGKDADFINCTAFKNRAETVEKWLTKGKKVGIVGRIQTDSYTNKDGNKVYTTSVIVDLLEFMDSKKAEEPKEAEIVPGPVTNDAFMDIPDGIEEDIPFK